MTVSETPQPPERPEDEGIPDHAADTSTAYDQADRPTFDDSPPALPADQPQAVDEFGVTAAEQRQGEPMEQRLAREEPDVAAEQRHASPGPRLAGEVVTEQTQAQAARDAETLGVDRDDEEAGDSELGRLVEPDEGARTDAEKDAVAAEQGQAGGGLAAEEAAMHEVPDDEVPYR